MTSQKSPQGANPQPSHHRSKNSSLPTEAEDAALESLGTSKLRKGSTERALKKEKDLGPGKHRSRARVDEVDCGEAEEALSKSSYYSRMKARIVEERRRPGYPPSAYCLFSEKRRLDFRLSETTLSQNEILKIIKREWKTLTEKGQYQRAARALYLEFKDLLAQWHEIQNSGGGSPEGSIINSPSATPTTLISSSSHASSRKQNTDSSPEVGYPLGSEPSCRSRIDSPTLKVHQASSSTQQAAPANLKILLGSLGGLPSTNPPLSSLVQAAYINYNNLPAGKSRAFASSSTTTKTTSGTGRPSRVISVHQSGDKLGGESSSFMQGGAAPPRMTLASDKFMIKQDDHIYIHQDQTHAELANNARRSERGEAKQLPQRINDLTADGKSDNFLHRTLPYPWSRTAQLGKRRLMPSLQAHLAESQHLPQLPKKRLKLTSGTQHKPSGGAQSPIRWAKILADKSLN